MTENFIAIAVKGKEFLYKRSSMIAVPDGKAQMIVDLLNSQRHQIKDGEVWHIYGNDFSSNGNITQEIRSCRKGRVIIRSLSE